MTYEIHTVHEADMPVLMTAAAAERVEKSGNDLGTVCQLVSAHRRGDRVMGFLDAKRHAKRLMAGCAAMRSVDMVVMMACDRVDLVRFGRRGGYKRITRILDAQGQPV